MSDVVISILGKGVSFLSISLLPSTSGAIHIIAIKIPVVIEPVRTIFIYYLEIKTSFYSISPLLVWSSSDTPKDFSSWVNDRHGAKVKHDGKL